jgi:hypothetical protein
VAELSTQPCYPSPTQNTEQLVTAKLYNARTKISPYRRDTSRSELFYFYVIISLTTDEEPASA